MTPVNWMSYAAIEKIHSTKWSASFRFTDADEEFDGCRCSGDHVLDIFVGYGRTKVEAQNLCEEWLIEQAKLILDRVYR